MISCIPIGEDGVKVKEPEKEDIIECSDRVLEIYEIAKPTLTVLLGKIPKKYFEDYVYNYSSHESEILELPHPAYILRLDDTVRQLNIERCVAKLRETWEEIIPF